MDATSLIKLQQPKFFSLPLLDFLIKHNLKRRSGLNEIMELKLISFYFLVTGGRKNYIIPRILIK
jgi:hypothetical protein